MINSKYILEEDSNGKRTFFKATIKIDKENWSDLIKNRILYNIKEDYDERYYCGKKDIATYFVDKGKRKTNYLNPERPCFNGNGITYFLKPSKRRRMLKINAKASGEVPRKEFIDLNELEKFILTEKYDYNLPWSNASFGKK